MGPRKRNSTPYAVGMSRKIYGLLLLEIRQIYANLDINNFVRRLDMAAKKEAREEGTGRLGVPPVREAYQEMLGTKKVEDEVEKRERRKGEKEHGHLEHEKARDYERHLPPIEGKISEERPPFKKR